MRAYGLKIFWFSTKAYLEHGGQIWKKVCGNSTEWKWFNEHLIWELAKGNIIMFNYVFW